MLLFKSQTKLLLIALLLAATETFAQGGCSPIDKTKPPLFISFAQLDDKAFDGSKYVKGALLSVTNNSDCRVNFEVSYGETPKVPASWVMRNGRMVRRSEVPFGSLDNGQRVTVSYLLKYPNKKDFVLGGLVGDMVETAYLNSGDHFVFAVTLKEFQRGAEMFLPFAYDWDEGNRGRIMTKQDGYAPSYEAVQHYLRFFPAQLPEGTLK
jgi:hypothetical protein